MRWILPVEVTDVLRIAGPDLRRQGAEDCLAAFEPDLDAFVGFLASHWAPTRRVAKATTLDKWLANNRCPESLSALQAKLADDGWRSGGGDEAIDILEARATARWLMQCSDLAFSDIVACTNHLVLPSVGADFRAEIVRVAAVDDTAKARMIAALCSCPSDLGFWARRDAECLVGVCEEWTTSLREGWPRPEPVRVPTTSAICHALAVLPDLDPVAWFGLLRHLPLPQVLDDVVKCAARGAPNRLLAWIRDTPEVEAGFHRALVACVEVAVRWYLDVDERLATELRGAIGDPPASVMDARRAMYAFVGCWLAEIKQDVSTRPDGVRALRGLTAWCAYHVWGGPRSPLEGAPEVLLYTQAMVVFGDALPAPPTLSRSTLVEQDYFALTLSTTLAVVAGESPTNLWKRWVEAISQGREEARQLAHLPGGWTHDCLGRLLCAEPDPGRRWNEALHCCRPGAYVSGPSGSLAMFAAGARALRHLEPAECAAFRRGIMEGIALYLAYTDATQGEVLLEILPEFSGGADREAAGPSTLTGSSPGSAHVK